MTTERQPDPFLEEAINWLLRLRNEPENVSLHAHHDAWLAASEEHRQAWARADKAWRLIGEVPPAHAEEWAQKASLAQRALGFFSRPARASWGALAFGIFALFVLLPPLFDFGADYRTAVGELRDVTLEDGSVVHLAGASAIATHFTPEERGVTLLSGEAFFKVTPNRDRPFVVKAEGLEVTVVGTAFDIDLGAAAQKIDVQSGAVTVSYGQGDQAHDTHLGPGERLTVDRQTGDGLLKRIGPENVAAWQSGRLFVEGATVAEVVKELSRYQRGWIYIANSDLASRQVTGVYDLRHPEQALWALVGPYNGRVRQVTPFLQVLSLH